MTRTEELMQERDDLKSKLANVAGASERETSDRKMMKQELQALEQRIAREETGKSNSVAKKPGSLTEKMDRKLDAALKDSFPGSDPVSFIVAAPIKQGDEQPTAVKAGKR